MSLKVSNIRRPVDEPEELLLDHLAKQLGVDAGDILKWRIVKKSLDARSRRNLRFVYSAVVELQDESSGLSRLENDSNVASWSAEPFVDPPSGEKPMPDRPIVIGSGPAGLLAGYYLALRGYRPLILERGLAVKERVSDIRTFDSGGKFDGEDNYLFGEGGAGCFSDGKLTCRMSGPDVDWVLKSFVDCGGRESITYEHRPHLGSNKLPMICRNYRRKIEALGGEYRFGCRFDSLELASDGTVVGVKTSQGNFKSSAVILGIGHSARDTYQTLHELGVPMQAKAFQLGLRIEQPQEQINQHKYGKPEYFEILGAADYTLVARGQRDLFSFCMCAGGIIIPSISEPEMFCSNGMSNSRHDSTFGNSGLVVTLEPSEFGSSHPLAGVEVQRKYEAIAFQVAGQNYFCPIQTAQDYLDERTPDTSAHYPCSYQRGTVPLDLAQVLPPVITDAIRKGLVVMDQKWRGQFLKNAMLVGPEMRGSSPVRIDRDLETRQAPGFAGLYPIGEGAGYAGGIISAAVDGLRSAKSVVAEYAHLT